MIPQEIKERIEKIFIMPWQIIIMIIILIAIAYSSLIWLEEDNPIEQMVEYVVEKETGISLDLTTEKSPL